MLTETYRITGNDIPNDVWQIIVRLVSSGGSATRYMSINRAFFNYALDQRYREVQWVVLDHNLVKQLDRLQSPVVAQHVHTLYIRAWFIEYLLKRAILFNPPSTLRKAKTALKGSLLSMTSRFGLGPVFQGRGSKPPWILQHENERSKNGPLSFEAIMKSMIQAVAGMTNVVELNFEWRDLPVNNDTSIFLTSTRRAFDRSLRKLTLRAPIAKFKELLPNTNFDNIEELDFHFDYRTGAHSSETSDPDIRDLLDTVIPFITLRRSSLQSLAISSSASTDLSSFFSALPSDFTSLRRFGFDISFHRDLLSNPNGIINLLESCNFSLRHISLSANWEHQHFGSVPKTLSPDSDKSTFSENDDDDAQSHNPWRRMNNILLAHPKCLANLYTLEIPFVSLNMTVPLIQRSCDTLTRLCLTGRYLTKHEVTEIVGLFSHRSLQVQRLQLPVAVLDRHLLLVLATRLPDLISLFLAFENLGDLTDAGFEPAFNEWGLSLIKVYNRQYRQAYLGSLTKKRNSSLLSTLRARLDHYY